MTADEIRQSVSMQDVLMRYGLKTNRNGKMCCPFHNEKTASFSVDNKRQRFSCFGCGKSGGIFDFVMEMEGCSFKEAYLSLGGEYEEKQDTAEYQLKRKALEQKWKEESERKEHEKRVNEFIPIELAFYRNECKKYEPLSDEWCFLKEQQLRLEILFDTIFPRKNMFDLEELYQKYMEIRGIYEATVN